MPASFGDNRVGGGGGVRNKSEKEGVTRHWREYPAVDSQGFALGVPFYSSLSYRERGSSVSEPAFSNFVQKRLGRQRVTF